MTQQMMYFRLTRVDGHDQDHISSLRDLVGDGGGRSVGRDGHSSLHSSGLDLSDESERILCSIQSSKRSAQSKKLRSTRLKKARSGDGKKKRTNW